VTKNTTNNMLPTIPEAPARSLDAKNKQVPRALFAKDKAVSCQDKYESKY